MAGFAETIRQFAEVAEKQVDAVLTRSIKQVGQRLIARSPVKSGTFASNWNYAAGAPDITETEKTSIRTVNHIGDIPEKASAFTHFIGNNLPYAMRLEFGFVGKDSLGRTYNQPPRGFVGLTSLEWPGIVAEVNQIVSSQTYIASAVPYASDRPPVVTK